jgi:hypothetical protein
VRQRAVAKESAQRDDGRYLMGWWMDGGVLDGGLDVTLSNTPDGTEKCGDWLHRVAVQ